MITRSVVRKCPLHGAACMLRVDFSDDATEQIMAPEWIVAWGLGLEYVSVITHEFHKLIVPDSAKPHPDKHWWQRA